MLMRLGSLEKVHSVSTCINIITITFLIVSTFLTITTILLIISTITRYSVGEEMRINCTSEKTLPPANLTWYINQQPVRISLEIMFVMICAFVFDASRNVDFHDIFRFPRAVHVPWKLDFMKTIHDVTGRSDSP